jgi:hypothetical protein
MEGHMTEHTPTAPIALVLLALAGPIAAQSRTARATPCARGVDFLAARRVGHGMVVAGAIANPRTDYRAVVVGGGTDLVLGPGTGVTAVLAAAGATDGASARLYVMPRLAAGRLALTATAAYQPLGGESLRQAALNPLTMALRVTPALQLGAAATLEMADGRLPRAGLGPSVQLRVPGGRLAVEVLAVGVRTKSEVRGAFSAALQEGRGLPASQWRVDRRRPTSSRDHHQASFTVESPPFPAREGVGSRG